MDVRFKTPFTCIVAGPTKAGKTSFVKQLLQNKERMFCPVPEKIWWCYTAYQPTYDDMSNDITFIEGLPDLHLIKEHMPSSQLLILDDLMQEFKNNAKLTELFTKGCHHWGVSVIHIIQNIFFNGLRTARVNSEYLVLLKNPSDQVQVQTIARQIFPNKQKYFMEAYQDATTKAHGYLLIDLTQSINERMRLRSDIFSNQVIVYAPKL